MGGGSLPSRTPQPPWPAPNLNQLTQVKTWQSENIFVARSGHRSRDAQRDVTVGMQKRHPGDVFRAVLTHITHFDSLRFILMQTVC
ncbi:uncharacterized protein [Physcomitrium patens]|uniref:Uncharacterized protein n=2 Tax=Physcomitrium patens TaxID=3218 RepID=A0A2K1JH35_PHYPA|nr:hypothetical protein PHYPA_018270 [Physcomitrium patens]